MKKLLIFIAIITLKMSFCGSERSSIELINDGDTLALSSKDAQQLLKRLLEDPLGLLSEHKKCEQELWELTNKLDDPLLYFEVTQNKFKSDRDRSPIFSIGECGSAMCGLSRFQSPMRPFYEKKVVSYLEKYKNQERINFVAFASGGLFQELIILAQAVGMHNIHNINIHLVDSDYQALIRALSILDDQPGAVNIAKYNGFNFHDYSLTQELDPYRQQACQQYLMFRQEKFRQFVSIVKQLSNNSIRVFLHQSVADYCEFCTQQSEMRADVVAAMDLEPEFGYETAIKDYYRLIYYVLKKGGVAILADNDLGAEKLNMIDYIGHKAPNAALLAVWSFRETMWKHVVDLSRDEIDSSLQYFDKFNSIFVGVHYKQAECSEECLSALEKAFAGCCNDYSGLNTELKKLDNNKFVSFKNEFQNISTTKKAFCCSLFLMGGMYAAKALSKIENKVQY